MYFSPKRLDLLCIFLIYSLDAFGIAIVYPIFSPIFLSPDTPFFAADISIFQKTLCLGLLLSLFPIAQFIGVPFIGDFSDKVGRKKVFSFTLLGSAAGYLLSAIAITLHSIPLLFLARILNGFFAGNTSLCFASLSDLSETDQERSKNFGLVGVFGGLSFFLSILCGEFFFNTSSKISFSSSFPFIIIALLSIGIFILMLCLFRNIKPPVAHAKFHLTKGFWHIVSTLKIKPLRNAYFIFFFFIIGWIASMQFYPSILLETYKKTPFSFTINLLIVGVTWSLANFLVQKFLSKRFSPAKILSVALPILFIFLISCSFPQSYISFTIHFSLTVFLAALIWSNALAHVSLSASKEIQGRIMGVNQSLASLGNVLAALMGGFSAAIHPSFVFFLSALCIVFSFLFLKKSQKNKDYS